MSWNYRVVDWGDGVDIREVYYDDDGKITHWTANPRELTGETVDDIEEDLRLILKDLRRFPPIPEAELPR